MTQMTANNSEALREHIIKLTGADPTNEPDFQWSDELPCAECSEQDSTAVLILGSEVDGVGTAKRVCFHCLIKA